MILVFRLDVPSLILPVGSCVVHHHIRIPGICFLATERYIELPGNHCLRFEREIIVVGPEIFLVCQSRSVEYAAFKCNGHTVIECP